MSNGAGTQSILFTAPGAINLTGGTGAILNTAPKGNRGNIFAAGGIQVIAGDVSANNPNITLTGGASGGNTGLSATNLGNAAFLQNASGTQLVSAGAIQLFGGAAGVDNSATILAPTQTMNATSLAITGGGNTGNFSGARMGGVGGAAPGQTNLTLTTIGDVTLTGGSGSIAAIWSSGAGGQATTITITSSGNVTLTPGSVGTARIGSPSASVAGGDISITAGGSITLNGTGAVGTSIRTTGNVTLAGGASQLILEDTAGVIQAASLTTTSAGGTTLSGVNQVSSFQATNTTSGSIVLNNASPTLAIAGIS